MGILADGVRKAFKEYVRTEDVFKFAREMVELGDRCRYRHHAESVHAEIAKIEGEMPNYIPKVQSLEYLKIKIKKKKGGSNGRGKKGRT